MTVLKLLIRMLIKYIVICHANHLSQNHLEDRLVSILTTETCDISLLVTQLKSSHQVTFLIGQSIHRHLGLQTMVFKYPL